MDKNQKLILILKNELKNIEFYVEKEDFNPNECDTKEEAVAYDFGIHDTLKFVISLLEEGN